ncbi:MULTISPECIES: long-chain fatty acid--CoA ligase [unclassified Bradyrhizobium]|uniref:AMP-dependent synthetase/ligase n=1 Tax=unclassified Bradyrhizobium TaxID=2631580 RepID=UPI001FF4663C|nr:MULTISPECIES: AMP-binding protein [unclassified Bradyrhizobium]MCJ9703190.1 AMP-binding protein [Bradyrhizobium sp. SHOUNA76]MCJ9731169.1 AMP-binding protein [Bradyrhizobium sp. PRIMUS42]
MSTLDSLRSALPPLQAAATRSAPASDVATFRASLRDGAITIPQMLRHRAAVHGEARALREKDYGIWNPYSWRHYYETARAVALGLLSLGIKAGDRIAIAGENTPEWFYADLGAQMIGAVTVGIYPTNPWVELQYIVKHSGARVVVTGDQEQTDKVLDAMANNGGLPDVEAIVCIDMKGLRHYRQSALMSFETLCQRGFAHARETPDANAALDRLISQGAPDDVCILVYTSGTTGPPKGAMLTHRNLVYAAYTYAEAVGIADRPFEAVSYLPLCHVAERCYGMVTHLVLGGTVSFAESIDTVATNIREIAPTFFVGVPRIYEKLQQGFLFRLGESGRLRQGLTRACLTWGRSLSDRRQAGKQSFIDRAAYGLLYLLMFRNLQRHLGFAYSRHRLCAGASISPETLRFFDIIGRPVSQGYGLTESGGVAFVQSASHHRIGGCGLPLPRTEWKLDDDGEILLRNPGVFKGYFLDEKASTASLENGGWLRTGDIVEVLDNGEIAVVDRKKAIIITAGGKNIAPSEIENALKDSEFVKEAIVVGEAKKYLGAIIQIDYDNVGRWARDRALAYTNYKSLSQLPEVHELVERIVGETNKRFARVENVRRFAILEKELDHDDGELTATQKVRRAMIEKKFARELAIIYPAEG